MDKPGLHCDKCGAHLCVKGVCTIYCPNKTCPAPAPAKDAILNAEHDMKAQGLMPLDQALFEVKYGPLGSDGAPEKIWLQSLTDASLENLPEGTKLFMQPFTPTLQGVTDAPEGAVSTAWAVMIVNKDGRPFFFLDRTEAQASSRLKEWRFETLSKQMRPVRVHGLTARAFEEAQHYRAASSAYAQNALDLRARCNSHKAHEKAVREKLDKVTEAVMALSLVAGMEHPEQWQAVREALALSTDPGLT